MSRPTKFGTPWDATEWAKLIADKNDAVLLRRLESESRRAVVATRERHVAARQRRAREFEAAWSQRIASFRAVAEPGPAAAAAA